MSDLDARLGEIRSKLDYQLGTGHAVTNEEVDFLLATVRELQEFLIAASQLALESRAELARLREEVEVSDRIIAERQRLLDAFPECEAHGRCVPHAIEYLARLTAERDEAVMRFMTSQDTVRDQHEVQRKNIEECVRLGQSYKALAREAAGLLKRVIPHCDDQEYCDADDMAPTDAETFLAAHPELLKESP